MDRQQIDNSKKPTFKFSSKLVFLMMFLGGMYFISRDYYCFFIAFAFFLLEPKRKMYLSPALCLLFLFSACIVIFNPQSRAMFTNMIKPFTYPLCFAMGSGIFIQSEEKHGDISRAEQNTKLAVYIMAFGTLAHYFLNWVANLNAGTRNEIQDFWSNDIVSATGQAPLACMMIAVTAATFFSSERLWKKIVAIGALAIIVGFNLMLAGRTLFALLLITFVLAFFYRGITQKNGKMIKTILITAVIVAAVLILYHINVFNIKTTFENSNFYERFFGSNAQDLDEDKRSLHKLAYIERFWQHPFGGGNIRAEYGHSAHDLYLDTYDESGIFALLFIVLYIASSLLRLLRVLRDKQISFETKQLILCFYVVVNIQFWLEPIIRGMPWLLSSYCFVDGAISYLLRQSKKSNS